MLPPDFDQWVKFVHKFGLINWLRGFENWFGFSFNSVLNTERWFYIWFIHLNSGLKYVKLTIKNQGTRLRLLTFLLKKSVA
ncbi:hypothetical protein HYN43_014580 [Mucilaginibacter celer]|uniref:Uncharacterized protein n=1 Tax=Mucilaginibacter celer TaxID=2305508 RepID=A0A494VMC1_9SPHI|nr:hypothetical protein HYN43_014580 [Mucilaginibacter celer]